MQESCGRFVERRLCHGDTLAQRFGVVNCLNQDSQDWEAWEIQGGRVGDPASGCQPAQPLTTANPCTRIFARKERSHDHAEPRSRNQPARKGAQGAPSPPGPVPQLPQNCTGPVPRLFHKCPTFVPRNRTLSYEMGQNGTVWDSFRQNRPCPTCSNPAPLRTGRAVAGAGLVPARRTVAAKIPATSPTRT